jgi:SSS family solute:Na+ symporter
MEVKGGFAATMAEVHAKHPELFSLKGTMWTYPMIFGFASAMCLGSVCFPQPYMHAYSSHTAKGFKVMILAFGAICVVVISMTTMIGIAGRVLVPGLTGPATDKIYGEAAKLTLPPWAAALAVAGAFTAAMTTVIGVVFGNASNIANDLYKLVRPQATHKELVRLGRICIAGILAVCIPIVWNRSVPVAELAIISFGIMAVTIFPLFGAYFWRRATRHGAIAATIIGVGMNLAFLVAGMVRGGAPGAKKMLLLPQPFLYNLNGFLVSFIVAGVVFFLVSLATRPGDTERRSLDLFFHPALD